MKAGGSRLENHQECNCHECTQARWKNSLRGQIEQPQSQPELAENASEKFWSAPKCAECGRPETSYRHNTDSSPFAHKFAAAQSQQLDEEIEDLLGYHSNSEVSMEEHIQQLRKNLSEHLNRVGKPDNLEYLITQACNAIYNGNIPLGICEAHRSKEGKFHARVHSCKNWALQSQQPSQWISVETELPKKRKIYLTYEPEISRLWMHMLGTYINGRPKNEAGFGFPERVKFWCEAPSVPLPSSPTPTEPKNEV